MSSTTLQMPINMPMGILKATYYACEASVNARKFSKHFCRNVIRNYVSYVMYSADDFECDLNACKNVR